MTAFSDDRLSVIATKLDTILVVMPKLVGEEFFMCTIRVEYGWKPPRCSSCKVFGHVLDECHKKIISDAVKNLKNPRQATRGIQVGPKQAEVPSKDLSNLNPFDAFNSVENDDDLGTNGGNSKSAGKGSLNVAHGESDRGYGTNSVLEQWRVTKRDDDYDSYDDDFYESHDMSDHLHAICDDLDITVRGRKKK
ncbi:hypothetical protein Tco_0812946 [Tanacetum coccineum]